MKQKFLNFMRGRYGADKLNQHLLYLTVILALISMITKISWLSLVWLPIMIVVYFRMFSKNITKRYEENQAYLYIWNKLKGKVRKITTRIKDFPKYKYLKCSECGTQLRVPRRKGKISVTCPKCRHKFDAKS
ncbi:hypothetical protein G7062_04560 [Erysipelothrix sp. HDW6C]|uniref:hypothetical protein n=1 Tax=Erysipelothrix sp. HDW6C TaxID=2714930 RepID=UPI00140E20B0|nr:hypothetical protein [Erysipelothrix sp. HDW6C]QIK69612.1 hypothetical protein G7062_04560 [Erysipelothrix sp. HDW6C]